MADPHAPSQKANMNSPSSPDPRTPGEEASKEKPPMSGSRHPKDPTPEEQFSLSITGLQVRLGGSALVILALGIAAAMGVGITVRLMF